jgi:pimeloyl-ACP methyl ester carboxylesterase
MAERLPNSRLSLLEHSGHLYSTEEPEVDHAIAAFFEECDAT